MRFIILLTSMVAFSTFAADSKDALAEGRAAYERKEYWAALNTLQDLVKAGSAEAQYISALATVDKDVFDRSLWPHAVELLLRAAHQDHRRAQVALAGSYLGGSLGLTRDTVAGAAWLQRAADAGDGEALFYLGTAHLPGGSLVLDPVLGSRLIHRAAESGYPDARFRLFMAYDAGNDLGLAKDPARAREWRRRAAESGHLIARALEGEPSRDAALALALDLRTSGGWYQERPALAAEWARKAAQLGSAQGALILSRIYEKGDGLPADRAEARAWCLEAVRLGSDRVTASQCNQL